MRAFVTGGTGLLGRHVVNVLLVGGWEVSVLARDPARAAGVSSPRRRVPMALVRFVARFSEWNARRKGRTPLLSRAALRFSTLDVVVDASKARQELGWSPRPFEDRLKETMAWYVDTYAKGDAPLPVKRGGASAAGPPRRA